MQPLKVGISGIRGIVGEALTPEVVLKFTQGFATMLKGKRIIVARDTRVSSPMYKYLAASALISCGCEVIDLNILPTPTAQIMVRKLKAAGAAVITASHNPIEYNGLKFINKDGFFLDDSERKRLLAIYNKEAFKPAKATSIKKIKQYNKASSDHLKLVLRVINPASIRKSRFKVAFDCCNGAGIVAVDELIEKLNLKGFVINKEETGYFNREPEPLTKNLKGLSRLVKKHKCDIGFAQDPDGDRLAIVDNKGRPIGEEYTLVLAAKYILSKNPGSKAVTNLSTTRAIDDIAKKYKGRVLRTPVGEINVVTKLLKTKAALGGEGNGGVILPDIHPCRDSILGMSLILKLLSIEKRPLSEILAEIPQYKIVKKAIECPPKKARALIKKLKTKYSRDKINTQDGLKVNFKDSWLHVRPSNTEPKLRIIAEATTQTEANKLVNEVVRLAK